MAAENKDGEIKVRVTKAVKDALNQIANHRSESESVIVREAFALYLKDKAAELDPSLRAKIPVSYQVRKPRSKKGAPPRLRISEGA